MWLEGIDLAATGDARTRGVRAVVSFYEREGGAWALNYDEVAEQLSRAHGALLENERGRVPD